MSIMDRDEIEKRIAEIEKRIAEIRANTATLEACPRHRFDPDQFKPGLPRLKMTCLCCGGRMEPIDIRQYLLGFVAAGGDPETVWPGFMEPRDAGA